MGASCSCIRRRVTISGCIHQHLGTIELQSWLMKKMRPTLRKLKKEAMNLEGQFNDEWTDDEVGDD